jgi:hypothetical protein
VLPGSTTSDQPDPGLVTTVILHRATIEIPRLLLRTRFARGEDYGANRRQGGEINTNVLKFRVSLNLRLRQNL